MSALIERIEAGLASVLDQASLSTWKQVLLIIVVAAAMFLPGLATLPVTDRDEARFAQASKQMLETGDLIDIRFQDQPRWKKPVGIYWLQAGSAKLFGGGAEAEIWAYRLPSVLGALLTALLTIWAARPLIGARGGVLAGMMMAATLLLAAEANIAKTDAMLAACAAAALGGLAHVFFGRGGWGAALVFWLAIAAAILLKGPVIPVIALIALIGLAINRETRAAFRRLHLLPGLVLVAVLVTPWLYAIWQISDGAFFTELLGRDMGAKLLSGQEKHWGPPGLYFALVWATFWPWAALLPMAASWFWAERRKGWPFFLALWIIPFWLILELVPTKLPHYVLPLYPALVIALAGWVLAGHETPPAWARRISAALIGVPGVVLALAVVAVPIWAGLELEVGAPLVQLYPAGIATALAGLVFAVVAARAALSGRVLAQIGASMIAAATLYISILNYGLPGLRIAFPSYPMAAALAQYRPCASGPAFSVGYHEPSLVFLSETGLRLDDPEGAVEALKTDAGAMVLIEDRWLDVLASGLPPADRRARFRYFNYNRGRMATAVLLTPRDPRWQTCSE